MTQSLTLHGNGTKEKMVKRADNLLNTISLSLMMDRKVILDVTSKMAEWADLGI